jgi:hypothetical protein
MVKKTRQRKAPESRHQRDLRVLQQVRIEQSVVGKPVKATTDKKSVLDSENNTGRCKEYTFDWSGNPKRFLVPRLEDVLPFSSDSLRELVICTAKGEKTPLKLKEQLMECPGEEVARAIVEGIRRWHTYNCGKEKE